MFNILIRTSNRPHHFNKCIKSILQQTYENYRIIICYDDVMSKEYIDQFKDTRIESYYINIEKECCLHYKYNLYCNFLLSKVNNGWIIFVDDDNMFTSKYCLSKISNIFDETNDLIFWKVKINDKIVYPINYDVKYGSIDSGGFCFHSKYKKYSNWKPEKGSDYIFINSLIKNVNFNKKMINDVLLKSQSVPNNGKKMLPKKLSDFNIKSMYTQEYYVNNFNLRLEKFNDKSKSPCLFIDFKTHKDLHIINNYKGWVYLLITNENDFFNLKEIKRNIKIKILIMSHINQNIYISLLIRKLFFLHFDIIVL